jgi:hypothetical protein
VEKTVGAQDIASNEVSVPNEEDTQNNTHKRKARRKTSVVRDHFSEVEVGGIKKNQCK